jgi:hypothetical protein
VVELFTSQGCAACPPADAMMAELAARDDVIALSLHVDYWNYLGWEDTFSQAVFTDRQYGYGRAAGSTVVYTPQLIVGGQDRVMGARAMELADRIAAHRAAPDPVAVEVAPDGGGAAFMIRAAGSVGGTAPEMVVHLVAYSPHEVVEIRAAKTRVGWRSITTSCAVGGGGGLGRGRAFQRPGRARRRTCRRW